GHPILFLYVCCSPMVGYRRSDKTSEGKDRRRCLPLTSIPARPGWSACLHQPRGILHSSRISGCIAFEMKETFMGGDISSHISSWYWTYSSIRFHPSYSSWKRIQALLTGSSSPCLNQRIESLRDEVRPTEKKWSRNRDTS
ncbi:hypothetical protein Tco_1498614, partial [Tanacetum coccineum]